MKMATSVEEYIENQEAYSNGLEILRQLMLSTNMQETVKWGMPTYTINNKNVLGISAFKHHFGVWFFNGVFLADPHQLLYNAQEGKTKGLRQLRFTDEKQIDKSIILAYVYEAIDNQRKGLEVKPTKKPLIVPKELAAVFSKNDKLAALFEGLSLGKKREFTEYISNAKREETKLKRIEKSIPMILNNIGLNDKYR